jgi:hypothetical protein
VPRRRQNINPYPDIVSDRVWFLLHAWAEWRSTRSVPRALPMPEETGRYRLEGGRLVYEPAICLEPPSTKPPEPGVMETFNQCMMDLAEDRRAYLVAVVERQAEPWLSGEEWRTWFRNLGLSKRDFQRLLKDALRALSEKAGQRGLR